MMRKLLILWFLIFLLLNGSAFAVDVNFRPKLAFAPFLPKNIEAVAFAENLSSLLFNSIDRTGFFEIMERRKIEGTIELEGLRLDNLAKDDLYRIGRRGGVDFLVYGSVRQASAGMVVEVELLSIRTNRSYYYETFTTADYEISKRLQKLAADMIAKVQDGLREERIIQQKQKEVATPTALEASGSTTRVRLRWKIPEDSQAAGFMVYRATSDQGPFARIATCSEPAYTDGNLKVNEAFYYRVKAVNSNGDESGFSETAIGKTSIAPFPPIFLNAAPEIKGSRLFWRPRPGDESNGKLVVAGYKVYRKASGDNEFVELVKLPKDVTSYRDSGLKENIVYSYAITSFNSDSIESEYSAQLNGAALPAVGKVRVESRQNTAVMVGWDPSESESVVGYYIYRSDLKDDGYKIIAKVEGRKKTSWKDSAPENGKTYWYRVTAYNKEREETAMSEPASATTRKLPKTPANLRAVSGLVRKVALQWDRNPESDIKAYEIYRGLADETSVSLIGRVREPYFEDSGLKDGINYNYAVKAVNEDKMASDISPAVAARTKPLPIKPAGVRIAESNGKRIITWESSSEKDVRRYNVYKKVFMGMPWKIATVSVNSYNIDDQKGEIELYLTALDDDGLESEKSEAIRVR